MEMMWIIRPAPAYRRDEWTAGGWFPSAPPYRPNTANRVHVEYLIPPPPTIRVELN